VLFFFVSKSVLTIRFWTFFFVHFQKVN